MGWCYGSQLLSWSRQGRAGERRTDAPWEGLSGLKAETLLVQRRGWAEEQRTVKG